jgi:hypothetical protein
LFCRQRKQIWTPRSHLKSNFVSEQSSDDGIDETTPVDSHEASRRLGCGCICFLLSDEGLEQLIFCDRYVKTTGTAAERLRQTPCQARNQHRANARSYKRREQRRAEFRMKIERQRSRQCFKNFFTAWLFQVRKAQIILHQRLRSRRQVLGVIFSAWQFKVQKGQVKRDDLQFFCQTAMNKWQQQVVQKLKILRIIRAYQNICRSEAFQRHLPRASPEPKSYKMHVPMLNLEQHWQKMVPVGSTFSQKSPESTCAAQFKKSDRYEMLHSKLRQLLIMSRNALLSRYALYLHLCWTAAEVCLQCSGCPQRP